MCDVLERAARIVNPRAVVWRGSDVATDRQWATILGTPMGHPDFITRHLGELERSPRGAGPVSPDARFAEWVAGDAARANYQIRCVSLVDRPNLHTIMTSKSGIVCATSCGWIQSTARELRVLDFAPLIGMSRIAQRKQTDLVGVLGKLGGLSGDDLPATPGSCWSVGGCVGGVSRHASLGAAAGAMGVAPLLWHALAAGARPESQPEEFEIRSQGGGQHEAASRVDRVFRDVDLFSRLDDSPIAMQRSQGGPGAGLAVICPTCRITKMELQLFRVLLLRLLQLPLPMIVRNCFLLFDLRGHHRAACALAGVLGKLGFSLESICKEAGTVAINKMVRDLDLVEFALVDGRRLEVVVDRLPLFGNSQ